MTQQDIQKVQTNLANMQAFNDYIFNSGNPYIINCFALLSKADSSDPGNKTGMALLEGSLGAMFWVMDSAGAFASCFLCSIVSEWGEVVPPNLAQTFSNMMIRYDKSHVQLDQDISVYAADPSTYWNKTFTWNNLTITLGQLATIDFPAQTDPNFYVLADPTLLGLDKAVWSETLKTLCKTSHFAPDNYCECVEVSKKTDMNQWYKDLLSSHPARSATWTWHNDTGLFDKDEWHVDEACLNFKEGTAAHFQEIPNGACQYLFINSIPGTIINPQGLFTREYVFDPFNGMNLQRVYLRTYP